MELSKICEDSEMGQKTYEAKCRKVEQREHCTVPAA